MIAPGFLIIHLGSIEQDHTVDTAAGALYKSMYSLFSACDIPVELLRIRTTVELSEYMKVYRNNYSHLILIGHGSREGLTFLDKPTPIGGYELGGFLGGDKSDKPIQIISICCHSGCDALSKGLSKANGVTEVLAPNTSFDMRWAVHFITGYFLYMYIENKSVDDAIREASRNSGNIPMCIWKSGVLTGTCSV